MAASRLQNLGGLFETERGRQLQAVQQSLPFIQMEQQEPYQQLQAIQQFGGLPRQLATAQSAADYEQQLQNLLAPYHLSGPLAQALLGHEETWTQPEYYQERNPLLGILGGTAGGLASGSSLNMLLGLLGGASGGWPLTLAMMAAGGLGGLQ
jgi:hypothetical protein